MRGRMQPNVFGRWKTSKFDEKQLLSAIIRINAGAKKDVY
jgi:hypothetical protein